MKQSIAIYGSHDANISIRVSGDSYRVYELERLTQKRYYSLNKDGDYKSVLDTMFDLLKKDHGFTEYDSIFFCECDPHILSYIREKFAPAHMEKIQHHFGHAACALWQSPFEQALIVSFDGGGWDIDGITYFNIFLGDKNGNTFEKIGKLPLDICSAYTMVAYPLEAISKTGMDSYLAWAGKIMGLAAYGEVKEGWIRFFKDFYYGNIDFDSLCQLYDRILDHEDIEISLSMRGEKYLNYIKNFQLQADIAATSQAVFEEIFIQALEPYLHKYDLPVCLTGGGALNVINNQKMHDYLKKDFDRKIFIPSNPNDCGLSLGFMFLRYPPDSGKLSPVTYSGFNILDRDIVFKDDKGVIKADNIYNIKGEWKIYDRIGKHCNLDELAKLLVGGKIIGFMQGNSEVGPRALGNRSILAYPMEVNNEQLTVNNKKENVKDFINDKIKFREWYRPVSPVIRREDVGIYFSSPHESEFMSYSQRSIHYMSGVSFVHRDNTARVQTVTEDQNKNLHDLLTIIHEKTGHGILINTSFNSKGKPILTTIKEALKVLDETELDAVWIEGFLFEKTN